MKKIFFTFFLFSILMFGCQPSEKSIQTAIAQTQKASSTAVSLLCADVEKYLGGSVTCKIPRAYCSYQPSTNGQPTFCNEAPYPNNKFTLVTWGNDWSDLDGKCIIVTGLVGLRQDKIQIEASSRQQVSLCQ